MRGIKVDHLIFLCTVVLLGFVVGVIVWNVATQVANYRAALEQELASQMPSKVFLLSANRALDFVLIRSAALIFGVALALLGALYLFKVFDTPFDLSAGGAGGASVTLKTSSPGLVMIACGVLMVGATVYARSTVTYGIETRAGVERERTADAAVPLREAAESEGSTEAVPEREVIER